MADTIYKVKDPTGAIREIKGPEGASDAEVIAQAQKLFSAPPKSSSDAPIYNLFGPAIPGARLASEAINKVSDIAGSGVTEGASRMGLSPEVSAGLGTTANIGTNTLIAAGLGKLATGAAPVMESGARRLMQSAVKPSAGTLASGEAPKAITTMLERGINATESGMQATQARVTSLEGKLQGILDQSPALVDPYKAADNIKKAVASVSLTLDRAKNLRDIEKVYDKFVNHEAIRDMGGIPVALANKMKQAFYSELKDKAFVPGADLTAAATAQKALAGGLRQEVAAAEPAVVPTLAEQSELINVLKVAGPQAAREGNKNIIGLGSLSPRLENVLVWMVDRYPWFKSMLARGMYAGSERLPQAAVGMGVAGGEALSQQFNKK